MKRAGLIYSAEGQLERFNSLDRREQLPFSTDPGELNRYQDYSLENAFQFRLLMDGMDHHGLGVREANHIVQNGISPANLDEHPLDRPVSEPDIFVAGAVLTNDHAGMVKDVPRFHTAGTLDEIPGLIAEKMTEWPREKIVRVVMLNASRAARFVRERAIEMEIPEGLDFTPVWGGDG